MLKLLWSPLIVVSVYKYMLTFSKVTCTLGYVDFYIQPEKLHKISMLRVRVLLNTSENSDNLWHQTEYLKLRQIEQEKKLGAED